MKFTEAAWNEKTKKGTYRHTVHHGEMVNGTKIQDRGSNEKQDLLNPVGLNGAAKLLIPRYKN